MLWDEHLLIFYNFGCFKIKINKYIIWIWLFNSAPYIELNNAILYANYRPYEMQLLPVLVFPLLIQHFIKALSAFSQPWEPQIDPQRCIHIYISMYDDSNDVGPINCEPHITINSLYTLSDKIIGQPSTRSTANMHINALLLRKPYHPPSSHPPPFHPHITTGHPLFVYAKTDTAWWGGGKLQLGYRSVSVYGVSDMVKSGSGSMRTSHPVEPKHV